jgi:hypothetical protein
MKTLLTIIITMLANPAFADTPCEKQVSHVESIHKQIISLAKECDELPLSKQLTCYQVLAGNQEALAGALYHAEIICTKEAQIAITKLRKEVK